MIVNLPRWIDYLPDKTPLEVKGITPELAVDAPADSFQGNVDPALNPAIEFLGAPWE